jgi:hypothetical protein
VSAIFTTLGFVGETLLCIKLLFTRRPNEFRATVGALECLIRKRFDHRHLFDATDSEAGGQVRTAGFSLWQSATHSFREQGLNKR